MITDLNNMGSIGGINDPKKDHRSLIPNNMGKIGEINDP